MKQAYTMVTNLLTLEQFPMSYDAVESVKRSYAAQYEELDKYIKGEKDYSISQGKYFVTCGNFTARKDSNQ